jgi:hypothetical protein
MMKSKSEGYKLSKKFMNAKDIFKVVKNLEIAGYSVSNNVSDENESYYNLGYKNHLIVKYVGNENKSILPLYVFYKERKYDTNFLHDIQVKYYY